MDGTETKAFRSVLMGGFSKEDVNSYIEKMSSKNNEEAEKLRAELAKARAEAEAISQKLAEAENSAAESRREISSKLEEKERELFEARNEASELRARVESLTKVESEYAGRKEQLADIEISARARAGEIIARAEAEADERRRSIEKEIEEKIRAYEAKKAQMLRETSDVFSNLSRTYDALKSDIDTVDMRIARITDSVRDGASALISACLTAQDKIADIRAAISDEEYTEEF